VEDRVRHDIIMKFPISGPGVGGIVMKAIRH
jgi:hypothetical protein